MTKITIKETNAEITHKVLVAIREVLGDAFLFARPGIKTKTAVVLRAAILASDTVQDMFGGHLQGELGITRPDDRIEKIIDTWINSIDVRIRSPRVVGKRITGGLELVAVPSDHRDVLGLEVSSFFNEKDNQELKWLDWILNRSTDNIIMDYSVDFDIKGKQKYYHSRTGLAIMVETPGSSWHVPSEFAGMPDDNFVTKAIGTTEQDICTIIETEIGMFV